MSPTNVAALLLASTWAATAAGCGAGSHGLPGSRARAARGPEGCRAPDGRVVATDAALRAVMHDAVNPWMTRVSYLMFHDPRGADSLERTDETVAAAEMLAACFATVPPKFRGMQDRADFETYALLQVQNGRALAQAFLQYDRNAALHWFLHVKETCNTCHAQFRPASEGPAKGPAEGGRENP